MYQMHETECKKTVLFIADLEKIVNKIVFFFLFGFSLIYQLISSN